MNTDTLQLLTTEQALADLANFIIAMNQQYNFPNPRWVTFGGSYPGSQFFSGLKQALEFFARFHAISLFFSMSSLAWGRAKNFEAWLKYET